MSRLGSAVFYDGLLRLSPEAMIILVWVFIGLAAYLILMVALGWWLREQQPPE